jgi:hypothetical protein
MKSRLIHAVVAFVSGCLFAPGESTAEPLAVFEAHETLNRDWPRTLVTYQVTGIGARSSGKESDSSDGSDLSDTIRLKMPIQPALWKLVDTATSNEVPFQLSQIEKDKKGTITSARLSFFASLSSNGLYRYEFLAGPSTLNPEPRTLSSSSSNGFLTLDNGLTALRLPSAGEKTFEVPLSFSAYPGETGAAPGPIQGMRLSDGRWVGGSFFCAAEPDRAPRVTGYSCRITEEGPLFAEATIRYAFTNGGWYQLTARILAGDPAVRIDEQFDLGEPGSMLDYRLAVSLGGSWKPDSVFWYAPQVSSTNVKFKAKLAELGLTNEIPHNSRAINDQPVNELFRVAVRYPWAPNAHLFGLVNLADSKLPFLGVVPLHVGNWRGSTDVNDGAVECSTNGEVFLNWRLRASPHPKTALHTGEYDPALPLTFCRRQWALVGGAFQSPRSLHTFRRTEGYVTLDDYKGWVLDWPADPKVTFPRLVFGKSDVERLKTRLDTLPDAATLKTFLYFNETDARRDELWKSLTYPSEWSGPYGMVLSILGRGDPPDMTWSTHFRYAQMAGWAGKMDELLSSDRLSPDQRRRLRADLAALCSLLAEPDVNPRGASTHLGNPNMPINRYMALPFAAALIPDHPLAQTWLDVSARYLRYKLAMNTAPGGAWSELITYFGASAPHIMQGAAVLAASGRGDESTARLSAMPALFTLHLLAPPDPRFGGARELPNWGHEGADTLTHWLVAAANMRKLDPALARDFAWAWDRQGRPMNQHHDAGFSERAVVHADLLADVPGGYLPPALASAWLPGFGATLRAHAGTSNETYLSFRQGYMCSHSDPNQGDFTLFAKGAPLVTLSLHAYPLHQLPAVQELDKTFGWHSRVRFGSPGNAGGWPGGGAIGGVPGYSFSESVDYLRGIGDYPAGDTGGVETWTRQIAFMKGRTADSPDYFVMRDSFTAADPTNLVPTWWALRTLGPKTQVQATADGFTYQSAFGPRLLARFLQPAAVKMESRDVTYDTTLYFGTARAWAKGGFPTKGKENPDNATVTETLTINSAGPIAAGQDVLVVLAPQGAGEPAPVAESLGDGVARIVTAESTDTVFLGRAPFVFERDGIRFEGLAGAVRVYPKEVHLIISEGGGSVTCKGVTLRSTGPAVKIVPVGELGKERVYEIAQPRAKLKEGPMPEGCRISGDARAEVTIGTDRITGRSEGRGAFLYAPLPPGLAVLPMLVIDGQTYAPGVSGGQLIIPLMPGEHRFEVRALEQPPVFRNWQAW